ncbi:hypothetical protein [Fictibacillus sp. JL2B1089]|uniref:hypothetical protein n=1 Tax=Fictibacillus sp. JL2B1089 TaxID=3399565 RepID=UPI003A86F400
MANKYVVTKTFIDKNTKILHDKGSFYTADSERFEELKKLGYLEEQKIDPMEDLLAGTANEVIDSITEKTSLEDLDTIYKLESEDKNRKTVLKHIDSLRQDEKDESGKTE